MNEICESTLYEGLQVDLFFNQVRPLFGDLFAICGYDNPSFPSSGKFDFNQFDELQISQVDDYFGVQTSSGEGDDVAVWLYPLVDGEVVDHHPGPFDGIRLSYNVLRNPIDRSVHYLRCVELMSKRLNVRGEYMKEGIQLSKIRQDIDRISEYWTIQGVTVGSDEALDVDY